jgi:hypothetical protein
VPDWIACVHKTFSRADRRGRLWAHLVTRWDELTNAQMWTILDRWLTGRTAHSREDLLADVLLYRFAIARIAGHSECERLMRMIEQREANNNRGRVTATTAAMPEPRPPKPAVVNPQPTSGPPKKRWTLLILLMIIMALMLIAIVSCMALNSTAGKPIICDLEPGQTQALTSAI